ncbi:GntR family transcriptional regulator [candidate division KSB1 bacterium]|nr:GntR family transcriptional regulator [candidate division KSB1 bacterium]
MAKEEIEEHAYRSIIRMILDNQLKPGDILLETELANKLQVSRTPVRQALGRLVAQGFLDKKKKKGCMIPVPDAKDAKQVFLARETIEGQAAAYAALNATEADIEELNSIQTEQDIAFRANDKENYSLLNEKFHLGIARMSANKYLERYCQHIFWRSNSYIFFFDQYYRPKPMDDKMHQTPEEHKNIISAISKGDAELAKKYMTEHIRHTFTVLFKP